MILQNMQLLRVLMDVMVIIIFVESSAKAYRAAAAMVFQVEASEGAIQKVAQIRFVPAAREAILSEVAVSVTLTT